MLDYTIPQLNAILESQDDYEADYKDWLVSITPKETLELLNQLNAWKKQGTPANG